ncbi:hypothetical protein AGMMS49965_14640 [Bacteroidia bacterium]|nr:hypothetical protein AGMMS49965_14640 [Bacteroidia bacterium]
MKKQIICALALSSLWVGNVYAAKETFVREYTYKASEHDSKVAAKEKALTQMRVEFLEEEVGALVSTLLDMHLAEDEKGITKEYSRDVSSFTAGLVETKIISERWDGSSYYVEAELSADVDGLRKKLQATVEKQHEDRKKQLYARTKTADKEKKQEKRKQTASTLFKGNSYLFWNGVEFSYPDYFGTGLSGRSGGIFGVGFRVSAGMEIEDDARPFGYDLGFRLYPYNNLFLSLGYGTLGVKKITEFNESDGRWGTDGYRQSEGIKISAGYDLNAGSLFISFNAGMGYDAFMKSWQPIIGIILGMGGKLK